MNSVSKRFIVGGSLIVFFLCFGLNPAYAAHILDSASYYNDHPFRLTIVNPSSPADGVSVTVSSGGSTCNYNLTQIPSTTTWQSPYIYFGAASCGANNFLGSPTSITASSSDIAGVDTSAVTSGDEPGWPPAAMNPQPLWAKKTTSCSAFGNDADDDGICDSWENPAAFQGLSIPCVEVASSCTGITPYQLSTANTLDGVAPDNTKKDIYVEVDYMNGHTPSTTALNNVIAAFANQNDARLHIQLDNDVILHKDIITTPIAGGAASTEFDTIKKAYFGTLAERGFGNQGVDTYNHKLTSKKQVFHYALFIHKQTGNPTSSGVAEQPGNDFIISLGDSAFAGSVGSIDNQEGTFMHELGHNLNLDHGGNQAYNCKPNYLSVMSYSRQFGESYPISRDLDYSRKAIGPTPSPTPDTSIRLDEGPPPAGLVENIGGNGGGIESYVSSEQIVFGVNSGAGFQTAWTGNSVDWNGDTVIAGVNVKVNQNINWMTPRNCDGTGTALDGVKDWGTVTNPGAWDLTTFGSSSWNDGATGTVPRAIPGIGAGVLMKEASKVSDMESYNYPQVMLPGWESDPPKIVKYKNYKYYQEWIDSHWFTKYGNKVQKYKLSKEITSNEVREIRLANVAYLDYHIKNLKNSSFDDPANDKATLAKDLDIVRDFVKHDNMFDATYELLKTREDVKNLVIKTEDKSNIFSKIDRSVTQSEIASVKDDIIAPTASLSNENISFDAISYHIGNYATISLTSTSANQDADVVDMALVRVSTKSNPIGMIVELTETGHNTGIFLNKIRLSDGASDSTRDMPQLRVKSGETVTASYLGTMKQVTVN